MDWNRLVRVLEMNFPFTGFFAFLCFFVPLLLDFSLCVRKQMFSFFLYVSPTDWSIRTILCTQCNTCVECTCTTKSNGHALRAGCMLSTLAHDICLSTWLLALSDLFRLSGFDSLSEKVALSATLQFTNPLSCLYYNYTQNTTRITLNH